MSEGQRNAEQQRAPAPHYLERVIDGAFERVSVLEPRLPSRFEPQTVAVAAAVAWPADMAGRGEEQAAPAEVEDRTADETHCRTASRNGPALREVPRAAVNPCSESRRRVAPETARVAKADYKPDAAATPPVRLPERPSEEGADRDVLTPKALHTATVDAPRNGRVEEQRGSRQPVLDLPSGVLVARKVIATTKAMRQLTIVPAPESHETLPRSTVKAEGLYDHPVVPAPERHRIVVEPPTARHRPEPEPFRADAVAPSPEPVVNVTIGRIEVRAVLPQPGPARQRSDGPKPMRLDDYLKQRGAGR